MRGLDLGGFVSPVQPPPVRPSYPTPPPLPDQETEREQVRVERARFGEGRKRRRRGLMQSEETVDSELKDGMFCRE